jgi:hypothetical protein
MPRPAFLCLAGGSMDGTGLRRCTVEGLRLKVERGTGTSDRLAFNLQPSATHQPDPLTHPVSRFRSQPLARANRLITVPTGMSIWSAISL